MCYYIPTVTAKWTPNFKFVASTISEIVRGSQIIKVGHITQIVTSLPSNLPISSLCNRYKVTLGIVHQSLLTDPWHPMLPAWSVGHHWGYTTTFCLPIRPRQNVVVYARMLTYSDEELRPSNLGAVTIANYTFMIDTYHQIHLNICLIVLTLPIILTRQQTNHEQHEIIDI